jgi:tetratricopeptide (TPR) repeat protein
LETGITLGSAKAILCEGVTRAMFSNGSNKIVPRVVSNAFPTPAPSAPAAGTQVPEQIDRAEEAKNHARLGDQYRSAGQVAKAFAEYDEAARLQPENGQYYFLLAITQFTLGNTDASGQSLQTAVMLDPGHALAHSLLGYWYLTQGMVEEARASSDRAVALAPDDAEILASHASVLEVSGELDEAWEIIQGLIQRGHVTATSVTLYGSLAQHRGQQERALELMGDSIASGQIRSDNAGIRFIAAGLLDSVGRYDEAFSQAAYANELSRRPFDPDVHDATIDRLIAGQTRERMQSLTRATYVSDVPVFIVGMPRSGTSLVEQILASHPDVHGAGELDLINRVVWGTLDMLKAREDEYPACLERLTIDQANGMAQIYLEPLIALNPAARYITDKMPLNFLHLDLIQLLLPKARVIHCRRNPMDTCLSCYMKYFGASHGFKYDLYHLGRFHRLSDRLMAHWKKVLDLPILDVQYEEMVADQPGQARRMLEFLGLEWSDRCVRFHETKRAVATASVQQVRVPIYKSSMERWRHYEKHLGPLKMGLGITE